MCRPASSSSHRNNAGFTQSDERWGQVVTPPCLAVSLMTSPGSLTDLDNSKTRSPGDIASQLTSCHQLLSYNKLTFQNFWNRLSKPKENGTSETRTDMRKLSTDSVYHKPCSVLSDPPAAVYCWSLHSADNKEETRLCARPGEASWEIQLHLGRSSTTNNTWAAQRKWSWGTEWLMMCKYKNSCGSVFVPVASSLQSCVYV